MAVLDAAADIDDPARQLEREARLRFLDRDPLAFDQPSADRDGRVAAHGAVAFAMGEERGKIGAGDARPDGDYPVHARMPPRLQHQRPAEIVMERGRLPTLVEDGGAGKLGIAAGHDPNRLPGGVHVDDGEAPDS